MRSKSFLKVGLLFLGGLFVVLLSACGKPMESPETVMNKAKEALVKIASGHVEATVKARGSNGTDNLQFDGEMQLTFDKKDELKKKFDLHAALSGDLKAGEKALSGEFDLNFINMEKEYYIKLNKLSSSDESLASMQPLIDQYKGKWLRIAEDFIPENIRNVQAEDEATKLKRQQLQDLFVKTTLFDVTKDYGVEKVNGRSVYHYGLTANMEGFKDYMAKAAIIDGRELTSQEIEESVKVLTYVKDAQLYIDTENYYILKAHFQFTGDALKQDSNLEVNLDIQGSDFDKSVTVTVPEGAEDFNPLNLMMGLGEVPAMPVTETVTESSESPTTEEGAPLTSETGGDEGGLEDTQ